jgi:hypothetical protein
MELEKSRIKNLSTRYLSFYKYVVGISIDHNHWINYIYYMTQKFSFNSIEYDFWPIYESLREFYPIGIERSYPGIYFEYPGIKKLEKIVVERVHDNLNFKNEWENFWKGVSEETNLPIIGTTYGQAPSFSSYIILKEERGKFCDYFEELHFCVSLVGPFYTIIQQSRSVIHEKENKFYDSVNRTISSPIEGTKKYFDTLIEKIESKYLGFKFVPYFINEQLIEGLRVRYSDEIENRVYNGLFNDQIKLGVRNIGDPYFKMDDWKKK